MGVACVMRNGSVYNPTPQLPGIPDEYKESVSQESVSESKETEQSANSKVEAKGYNEKKDSVSKKSK